MSGVSEKTMKDTKVTSPPHSCQQEFDFALVLDGIADLTDEVMNRLFDAGCGDATFSLRYGLVYAEFSREAESYQQAILTAIEEIRAARVNAEVLRVNACDLVTPANIARRIQRSRELVSQYISGNRGPGGFPAPECFLAEDKPLWTWCAVSYWLAQNNLIRPEVHRQAEFERIINGRLAAQRIRKANPELAAEVDKALDGAGTSQSAARKARSKVA